MHHGLQVGYHIGAHAPGHKHPSDYWRVGHNVLLAHAAAVKRFRQTVPDGKIGIVANSDFFEPLTSSAADKVIAFDCVKSVYCCHMSQQHEHSHTIMLGSVKSSASAHVKHATCRPTGGLYQSAFPHMCNT